MSLYILHTGDWHVRDKDIEECRKVLTALCKEAIARKDTIDLVAIAGDLTDRNDVKLDSQTARLVISTVSRLSLVAPVVIISGTKYHDGNIPELLDGTNIRAHHPITVSTRPEQIVLGKDNGFYPVSGDNEGSGAKLLISTVPTPTKQFFDSIEGIEETDRGIGEALSAIFADFGMTAASLGLPHVPLGHWQVGGAYISETQQLIGRDIEVSVEQVLSANPSVTCLGHIHYAQKMGNHPIFYCGSSYRKDFGEMEAKGFWIHTIAEDGIAHEGSEWIELPTRKLVKVGHDYTATEAQPGDSMDSIDESYPEESVENAHIRVEFKVWQDQREQIDKSRIEQSLLDKGAARAEVKIIAVPRQNVRAERVLESERLRDKVAARGEIVGDSVSESILKKCDLLEAENREEIVENTKQAA